MRVFVVSSRDRYTGGPHERLLLCTSAFRRPRVIADGGADAEVLPIRFAIIGKRLAFEVQTDLLMGAAGGAPVDVGWIDLRTGPARAGLLNAGVDPQLLITDVPLLPFEKVNFAIAPDGWMAVLTSATSRCQVVAVLAGLTRPTANGYLLGLPNVLYTAPKGGIVPVSLTIDENTVAWKSAGGTPTSAPRATGTPATGTPPAQSGGC